MLVKNLQSNDILPKWKMNVTKTVDYGGGLSMVYGIRWNGTPIHLVIHTNQDVEVWE